MPTTLFAMGVARIDDSCGVPSMLVTRYFHDAHFGKAKRSKRVFTFIVDPAPITLARVLAAATRAPSQSTSTLFKPRWISLPTP